MQGRYRFPLQKHYLESDRFFARSHLNFGVRGRGAISPIVATVLIVALAVVASVAVSGFVFGTLSTQESSPQVSVIAASFAAADFETVLHGAMTTSFTCGAATGSYLMVSNTGTAGAAVTAVTLTWAGSTNSYSLSGSCAVGASGSVDSTQFLLFSGDPRATKVLTANAVSGGIFTGTVALSSGAVLLYTGTFR
jgi:hypothetical protein